MENSPQASALEAPNRWVLLRDIAVLQVKLVVDGLRDFLLVPVSIAAGIVSLLKGGSKPGTEFYDLLHYGRRTERVINLFGAAERVHPPSDDSVPPVDIDTMLSHVESLVVEDYRHGGVTAQARQRIEKLLKRLAENRAGAQHRSEAEE